MQSFCYLNRTGPDAALARDARLRPAAWIVTAAATLLGSLLLVTASMAAGTGAASSAAADARARHDKERAACISGRSNQDRETCLKEAGAAMAAARRDNLAIADASEWEKNRLIRCNALPQRDREDCVLRMKGEGVVSGSAEQGGIYRELVRTLPAAQAK